MSNAKSINTTWHKTCRIGRFLPWGTPYGGAHADLAVAAVLILSSWASTSSASSGPGVAVKIGAQTIDRPFDDGKTTRARFEVELASPLFGDDHFDVALTFGGSSLGSYSSDYTDLSGGVLTERYSTDDLSLFDVGLAARLYPLGDSSPVRPYVGAGIGYFWFLDSWDDDYYETVEDPFIPGLFHTYTSSNDGTDTLARGFFPFFTAGLNVPVGSNLDLLFELQYHLNKEDSGYDFSGPSYMFGCRFRF
jgi:Outer membrane protein beta-barrel domain